VTVSNVKNFQKTQGMPNDTLHCIFFVCAGIIGVSLTDFIYCYDPALLGQSVKVQIPVCRTVGTVGRAKIASMEQYDGLPFPRVEVTRSNTVHINKLGF
jgi:hypothetical protein